jgi:Leucine-rich repeat (LRR) protein
MLVRFLLLLLACQVLYIYDNLLSSISNIGSSRLLTHLYCQNNQLTSLQGIHHLPLLQKLYVQGNCLSAIDCLTKAQHLQELHVSDQHMGAGSVQSLVGQHPGSLQQVRSQVLLLQQQQQHTRHAHKQQPQPSLSAHSAATVAASDGQGGRHQQPQQQQDQLMLINDGCVMQHCFTSTPTTPLQDNTSTQEAAPNFSSSTDDPAGSLPHSSGRTAGGLWFDPASLLSVSRSLRVLAAANCGITDPGPLAVLTRLQVLDLAGNAIASLAVLQPVLGALEQLRELDLRENPCVHSTPKYRDSVVLAAAHSLEQLDGEDVTPAHRAFLQALHSRRSRAAKLRQQQQQEQHGAQGQQQRLQQASGTGCGLDTAADSGAGNCAGFGNVASADYGDSAHQQLQQQQQRQQQHGDHRQQEEQQQPEEDLPIAAGHHANLAPRCHQALDAAAPRHGCKEQGMSEPLSIMASGLQLQLPMSLQACRAAGARPTQAGGFKVVPTAKPGQGRLGAAAAAAGGSQHCRPMQM